MIIKQIQCLEPLPQAVSHFLLRKDPTENNPKLGQSGQIKADYLSQVALGVAVCLHVKGFWQAHPLYSLPFIHGLPVRRAGMSKAQAMYELGNGTRNLVL